MIGPLSSSELDSAVMEFIAEGQEIIERVGKNLQSLENETKSNPATVTALYRDMHTLKGSAQLFGFTSISLVAHSMEASLDPLRKSKEMKINSRMTEACLKNLDLLERMLKRVESGGSDSELKSEVNLTVGRLLEAASMQFGSEIVLPRETAMWENTMDEQQKTRLEEMKSSSESSSTINHNNLNNTSNSLNTIAKEITETFTSSEIPMGQNHMSGSVTSSSSSANNGSSGNPPPVSGSEKTVESSIRVHVGLLDRILNLVGELVLIRNRLLQHRRDDENLEYNSAVKILDTVTSDLQGEVMKTRMQPIDHVVSKFQRLVRDISTSLNKKIDLTLEGKETELDKTLLEAVKDPLTHIVRNSCDHGIESPEDRIKAGKPERGHLLIRSFHEGGQVVIEISDDGRGLNRQRILAKAIERGLLNNEQASRLQDREICDLIFQPGFSTAKEVTSVSGRGVGMDVVKTNIEKIGGTVELSSVEGRGTTIQMRIPLTLAIVPALLVKSGHDKFAIPQVKLVELVRTGVDGSSHQVEYLQGRPMFRLRGSLLPLLDLRQLLGDSVPETYPPGMPIAVLNAEGDDFGLIVEEILDTADIVVKPLSSFLKNLSLFSGATILGDGSIALILDVVGMAQTARVVGRKSRNNEHDTYLRLAASRLAQDIQEYLLFSLGTDSVHAIPLCLVQRLEELEPDTIEYSGEQRLCRYRGSLLPIFSLRNALKYPEEALQKTKPDSEDADTKRIPLIVVQKSGKLFGIEVQEIQDVVTIESAIDDAVRDRDGILGNLVYQESVVVVVDVLSVIDKVAQTLTRSMYQKTVAAGGISSADDVPSSVDGGGSSGASGGLHALDEIRKRQQDIKRKKIRVLFAEDVAFFRRHVSKVLSDAGMEVTTVENGAKGLQELQNAPVGQYNIILSDIEMPVMTGLEFAREVRRLEKFKELPIIALTTRFRDKDIQEGKQAGFDLYLEKLNVEKLLMSIFSLMGENVHESEGVAK